LYFGFSIGLSCQADEYKIPAQQQAVNVLMPLLACSFEMSGSVQTIEMKILSVLIVGIHNKTFYVASRIS
jgi:hypothetical protein